MAFNTKLKLIDAKFEQVSGATLTLSGSTIIADSGELKYASHPTFSEDTQIIDKKYVDDNIVSGVTGGTTYNLLSPAAIQVGGIDVDYILTGKTSNEIIQDMLFPEICGTLTAASVTSVTLTPANNSIFEIGCVLSTFSVNATFSRGSINPQYGSACAERSGPVTAHNFSGAQITGSVSCTTLSPSTGGTNHTIVSGANVWGVSVSTSIGTQPISNKNNTFGSPLAACTSPVVSRCYVGAYPNFATTSAIDTLTKQPLLNMSSANNIQYALVGESDTNNRQRFQIPCAWLSARPLTGICVWDEATSSWKYPGGEKTCSLCATFWTTAATTQSIQGDTINYREYENSSDVRGETCIRLVYG